jgi:hypothetical protein
MRLQKFTSWFFVDSEMGARHKLAPEEDDYAQSSESYALE